MAFWVRKHFGAFDKQVPGGILSLPLESCEDEASQMTLGIAFHMMGPLYLTLFLPSSLLYRISRILLEH